VAKYSEFWFLYVYQVHALVPSLPMPPPPHNCVQNKHFKIFIRCRFLYLCTLQRILKTHWDSTRTWLDSTQSVCITLDSRVWLDCLWTRLDSTQLCWWIRTLKLREDFWK